MCISPVILKKSKIRHFDNDDFQQLQVPCGKCLECRKARVNSWFVRLENEMKRSSSAYFFTLTYDDLFIPITDNLNDTLRYSDVQRFIKRLRKKESKTHNDRLVYYIVGEYGSTYNRPHYHGIIFNVSDPDNIVNCWQENGQPIGFVHIGKVEPASIYYTLKYTLKSSVNESDLLTDREPERALMSKGIGENFLTDEVKRRYTHQPERSITLLGNKKMPLPRYYRDKIFIDSNGQKRLDLIQKRNQRLKKFIDEISDKKLDPLYTQRIKKRIKDVRETIKKTD